MKYVRIYTGADGESHFEDVEVEMDALPTVTGISAHSWRSVPVSGALTFTDVDPGSTDEASPSGGGWGPWNAERFPQFVLWIEGDVEIQVANGDVRRIGPGDLVLAEDLASTGHRSRRLTESVRTMSIPLA